MGNEHRPSDIRKYDPRNIKTKTLIMETKDGERETERVERGYLGEKEKRNEHKNLEKFKNRNKHYERK